MRYEFVCTGLAGIVSLAAVAGALFAFPTPGNRPIAGLACSIVATDRISQAIGAEIQLAPSDGRVCTYDGLREPVRVVTIALATEPSRPLPAQARLAFSPDNRPVLVYVHGGPPQLAVARTEAVVRAIESVP